jgi:RNA polymerase sigma-70 factor (ECF subfamily)
MQIGHAPTNVVNFKAASKAHTDLTLMELIANGDRIAMQILFVRHRIAVYRFSVRLTNDQTMAEDVVSEVFLEVWRHARTFEGRSQVSTWLLGIARNLARSTMRRRPTEELSKGVAQIPDLSDDPEAAFHTKQQSAALGYCLTLLSPAHREVIDLVYYHGKSVGEVAEITGIAQATVKTRMFYARKEIAGLLDKFGITRAQPVKHTIACSVS